MEINWLSCWFDWLPHYGSKTTFGERYWEGNQQNPHTDSKKKIMRTWAREIKKNNFKKKGN